MADLQQDAVLLRQLGEGVRLFQVGGERLFDEQGDAPLEEIDESFSENELPSMALPDPESTFTPVPLNRMMLPAPAAGPPMLVFDAPLTQIPGPSFPRSPAPSIDVPMRLLTMMLPKAPVQ